MSAGHSHGSPSFTNAFAVGIALTLVFVGTEALFGWRAGSLALIADAGHNLSDVFALVLSWWAAALGRRAPTRLRTYGLRRASILSAVANAMMLLVAIGAIAWEAVGRMRHPSPVAAS